jgi:hypothetical protein
MTDLSPKARRLFELARHQDDPEPGAHDRVERSLGRRIALVGTVATGGAAFTKSAAGLGLMATAAKAAGVAAVVGAAAGAGWFATKALGSAPAATVNVSSATPGAPSARRSAPSAAPKQDTAEPEPAPTARPSPRPSLGAPRPSVQPESREPESIDQLRLETEGLKAIQQAVRAGDPGRALVLIDEQNGRYPGGLLGEERAAARVLALCQSGQTERARAEAAQFERRWPKSALVARVRSSCSGP